MTDVQLLHALEKSYQKFGIGKNPEKEDDSHTEVLFDEIDWQEMRYRIPEESYAQMWKYLPIFQDKQKVSDGRWHIGAYIIML